MAEVWNHPGIFVAYLHMFILCFAKDFILYPGKGIYPGKAEDTPYCITKRKKNYLGTNNGFGLVTGGSQGCLKCVRLEPRTSSAAFNDLLRKGYRGNMVSI